VFHGLLPTAEIEIIGYTIAASHYITVAAWDPICDLLCVVFFLVCLYSLLWDIQCLEVGIDDVRHAHLFVVVREL